MTSKLPYDSEQSEDSGILRSKSFLYCSKYGYIKLYSILHNLMIIPSREGINL